MRVEEKSTELYMEILSRFATTGSTVLDLYAGTASSAYAALKLGMKWIGCEIDETVHRAANERLVSRFNNLFNAKKISNVLQTNYPAKSVDKSIPTSNYPLDVCEYMNEDIPTEYILESQLEILKLEVKQTSIPNLPHDDGFFQEGISKQEYNLHILGRSSFRSRTCKISQLKALHQQSCETSKEIQLEFLLDKW